MGIRGARQGSLALGVAMALGLSACGGGGSNVKSTPPPPPPPPPPVEPGANDPIQPVIAGATLTVASGEVLAKRVELASWSVLDNAGTVGGMGLHTAVKWQPPSSGGSRIHNHDGGRIEAAEYAVWFNGEILNTGAGSTIHAGGTAIRVDGQTLIENLDGASITSGHTTIQVGQGSEIVNAAGSTIATTGLAGADCVIGACAIYVPADETGNGWYFDLFNAGTINGDVRLDPTASNDVHLMQGSVIRGNLYMWGDGKPGTLTVDGAAGSVQLYSEAVTGVTQLATSLSKQGEGTWVIDRDFEGVAPGAYRSLGIGDGVLQIGVGGTEGELDWASIALANGDLIINRSDDVIIDADVSGGHQDSYDGTFVAAGTGTVTVTGNFRPPDARVEQGGTLRLNSLTSAVENHGTLVLALSGNSIHNGIFGTGMVILEGPGGVDLGNSSHTGGTIVNGGTLLASNMVVGDVTINHGGAFKGAQSYFSGPVAGVAGNLANAGVVQVSEGDDTRVGGDYTQASTGTLQTYLGSKLQVSGTATLEGGTLYVPAPNMGFVANSHTEVLTAAGGVVGTFDQLVKGEYAVFVSETIYYDANSVWLDTTGLDVTVAAAGSGVDYTSASMAGAERVQGAFERLNAGSPGDVEDVSSDFLHSAGEFQRAPTLQDAQASLTSLAGQIHAAGSAMTFRSIDATNRAMSDRFGQLASLGAGMGMWSQGLRGNGIQARAGFDGVGFSSDGWLVGHDMRVGGSGVAGFAFGEVRGQQLLETGLEQERGRSTEAMLYAGWIKEGWYSQARLGLGHYDREVGRHLLLGTTAHGVQAKFSGDYSVAQAESGLRFGTPSGHVTPFASMQYARASRGGFVEEGAGGFGLRSDANVVDRWQAALGIRAAHGWRFSGDRALDVSARLTWHKALETHGTDFDASFVGLEQWRPVSGLGLSSSGALFDLGLDAWLSPRTSLNFEYSYETGDRGDAGMISVRVGAAF